MKNGKLYRNVEKALNEMRLELPGVEKEKSFKSADLAKRANLISNEAARILSFTQGVKFEDRKWWFVERQKIRVIRWKNTGVK